MSAPSKFLPHVDELVMEYLLFRGFTKTFQAFNVERKRDRTKGFDVDQIATQFLSHIQTYQLEPILDMWKFLSARFFYNLDASFTSVINHLEKSMLRLYVVNAIKSGHREKAIDFFTVLILNSDTNHTDSWSRWFILPYIQNPENDPYFKPFFDKEWLESLVTSFRNVLSTIFRNVQLPKLLAFQVCRFEEPSLKLRLKVSQTECNRLRVCNVEARKKIQVLEESHRQLYDSLCTMVQHQIYDHVIQPPTASGNDILNTLLEQLRSLSHILNERMSDSGIAGEGQSKLDESIGQEEKIPDKARSLSSPMPLSISPIHSQDTLAQSHSISTPCGAVLITESLLLDETATNVNPIALCAFSHSGFHLSTAFQGQQKISVHHLNTDTRRFIQHSTFVTPAESKLMSITWISDKKEMLLYALDNGSLNLWDPNGTSNHSSSTITYLAQEYQPFLLACPRHRNVGVVALHRRVQATQMNHVVQCFMVNKNCIQMFSSVPLEVEDEIVSMDWSLDGSMLVVACRNGLVSIYDIDLSTYKISPFGSFQVTKDMYSLRHIILDGNVLTTVISNVQSEITQWVISTVERSWPPISKKTLCVAAEPRAVCLFTSGLPNSFLLASCHVEDNHNTSQVHLYQRDDSITSILSLSDCSIVAMKWHMDLHIAAIITIEGKLLLWDFSSLTSKLENQS